MKTSLILSLLWLLMHMAHAQIDVMNLPARAERRVALVVGNRDYQSLRPLKNPVNDATDMTLTLQSLGFETITLNNITYEQFSAGLATFGEKLKSAEVAVVFYSGYGSNYQGGKYLFPVDLNPDCELPTHSIDLNQILNLLITQQVKHSFLFLDTCNDQLVLPNCPRSNNTILPPTVPRGSMVVYAAEEGSYAGDNPDGHNGVFTGLLLKHLTTPGLGIRSVIDRTVLGVEEQTNGKQSPVRYDRLTSDFVVADRALKPQPTTKEQLPAKREYRGMSALPLQVNLSPYVPPVPDQGKLPAVVSWATAYLAYTTQYATLHNITDTAQLKRIALSPMLPFKRLNPNCDKGLNLADIAENIRDHGNVSYADYPALSCHETPSAELLAKAEKNRPIRDVVRVFDDKATDQEKIYNTRRQLGEIKTPVIVGMRVTDKLMQLTASDIYYEPGGSYKGLHVLTVVGYDQNSFLLVNTWGTKWGNNGYFRMRFNDFAQQTVGAIVLVLPESSTVSR